MFCYVCLRQGVDFRYIPDIVTAVEVFTDTLRHLSDYFEVMQDLDECCWIIDPVNPSSKDNFRRIVVGKTINKITF